jgi:uncharacterized protein YjbI with pentapeptide repeats
MEILIENASLKNSPFKSVLIDKTSIEKAKIKIAPVKNVSTENASLKNAPLKSAFVEKIPIKKAQIKIAPIKNVSTENASFKNVLIENVPNEKASIKISSTEIAPIEWNPIKIIKAGGSLKQARKDLKTLPEKLNTKKLQIFLNITELGNQEGSEILKMYKALETSRLATAILDEKKIEIRSNGFESNPYIAFEMLKNFKSISHLELDFRYID